MRKLTFEGAMRVSRRAGKTLAAVEWTKGLQRAGKKVVWATTNQGETAELLSKHGALSEIVGEHYVIPHFKKSKSSS